MKNVICLCISLTLTLIVLSACLPLEQTTRKANNDRHTTLPHGQSPSSDEVSRAIKESLQLGVRQAIGSLGRLEGFNGNQRVRIPLPEDLKKVDNLLRKLNQERYTDEFVTTLNRAAEKAVPEAVDIFSSAIKQMSMTDVFNIITGPENAATLYFRQKSEQTLIERFRPVVLSATDSVGVTRAYKKLHSKVELMGLGNYMSADSRDIDQYITVKATDALFLYIADEEKSIRKNPIARTTELLQKVYAYYQGE